MRSRPFFCFLLCKKQKELFYAYDFNLRKRNPLQFFEMLILRYYKDSIRSYCTIYKFIIILICFNKGICYVKKETSPSNWYPRQHYLSAYYRSFTIGGSFMEMAKILNFFFSKSSVIPKTIQLSLKLGSQIVGYNLT